MRASLSEFSRFLERSYTAYHAAENAAQFLRENGFTELHETQPWQLQSGGRYFVLRGGSSLIAFCNDDVREGFKLIVSHTDSPCLKLKENAALSDGAFTRLNVEPYGGGLWYTFFDRPLRLAGRIVRAEGERLVPACAASDFLVNIPSLAIHMNREANEKFAPGLQTDLMPVLCLKTAQLHECFGPYAAADLFAACAEPPFLWGAHEEFLSAPRIDNLTGVFYSLRALAAGGTGACVAACLDSEEIGSRTHRGAGGDFLRAVLTRITAAQNVGGEALLRTYASSFAVSLDNAHSLHPNHPEKCDPTNRAVMGGGVAIKGHAGGAYTTDALTAAVMRTIFERANVPWQTFYNRSDMRSGSTLGAVSLGQVCVASVDLGLAQLAMHSAVETICADDCDALERGLSAFYRTRIVFDADGVRAD